MLDIMQLDIKQFIENVLNDKEILDLTADKKIYFLKANKPTPPYVEYMVFDEDGEAWAEGKEIATTYYIQVDVFSKRDYEQIVKKIKEKLLNAGFERSMAADLYDEVPQLKHKAMRFIFTADIN